MGTEYDEGSATTDDAMVPAAPTGLTAMKDATNSVSQINLSWTAPADPAGAPVTGNIIERRYTGDMMGDIPSDGYSGTDGANRSFAFSNAMEWWETLNCKGMLAAAGSDADPTMDTDDKAMYCGHFLNTEPSNVTDSAHELSDDAKAAVEALFDKRYEIVGDVTSHEDTGLMEMTEYTYRVSATNAKGRSPWSAADSATTDATNADPVSSGTLPNSVSLTVGEADEVITLTGSFTDPDEGDTVTYAAAVMPADGSIATASVSDDETTLTIAPVAAGTATVTVTASDGNGGTAMHDIAVTVAAAPPDLTAPTITNLNPVGSGLVTVTWSAVPGASGYTILAINFADSSDYETEPVNNPDQTTAQINDLKEGVEYLIFVAAFDADGFELSDFQKITAE